MKGVEQVKNIALTLGLKIFAAHPVLAPHFAKSLGYSSSEISLIEANALEILASWNRSHGNISISDIQLSQALKLRSENKAPTSEVN